jgi:uncharacterized membrane protein
LEFRINKLVVFSFFQKFDLLVAFFNFGLQVFDFIVLWLFFFKTKQKKEKVNSNQIKIKKKKKEIEGEEGNLLNEGVLEGLLFRVSFHIFFVCSLESSIVFSYLTQLLFDNSIRTPIETVLHEPGVVALVFFSSLFVFLYLLPDF